MSSRIVQQLHDFLIYLRPFLRDSIFNTAKLADTDLFGADIIPLRPPCIFRIYITTDAAGILSVMRDGGTTVQEKMNGANNLTADAAYIFDTVIITGETINLQYSAAAQILSLYVVEVAMSQ